MMGSEGGGGSGGGIASREGHITQLLEGIHIRWSRALTLEREGHGRCWGLRLRDEDWCADW